MKLNSIIKTENSSKVLAINLLLIVFLYLGFFTTLVEQNEQIQTDIKSEKKLSLYLDLAGKELSNISKYPYLSQEQANQQVVSTLQTQDIKINISNIKEKLSTENIKKISFVQLLDALHQLKTQHGIVVSNAVIELIEPGIVSAQLTFSNLTN